MWFSPDIRSFFSSCARECQRCKGSTSFDNSGPTLPVAIIIGLFCAYIWARLKPYVSAPPDERKNSILEDLTHAKSFLSNLHDHIWNAKGPTQIAESISKEGEDILLSKRGGAANKRTSESILGSLVLGSQVEREEVNRLQHKLSILGAGDPVYQVFEDSVLLQTRLPITRSLLNQAFDVAKQGIALDQHCTFQLGSWGIIMHSGGSVRLLRLQDGDVPVLLDSFREEGEDLRIEGLFLEGVQMRVVTAERSSILRSKVLLKGEFSHNVGAGWMDVLIVRAPFEIKKTSLTYATKIVDFKGVSVAVRSGLIPVGILPKPEHSDPTSLYFLAALAFVVALLPSKYWLPILGKIGMVFLPVLQLAAIILGWNLGHFLLLGEWPSASVCPTWTTQHVFGAFYMFLCGDLLCAASTSGVVIRRQDTKLQGRHLREVDDNVYKFVTPWDSVVRMEMNDLERQIVRRLEKQPSVSNVGIYAQQADYRTDYWQKGVGEMNQAIEIEPQNELPFRIRGCIKGLAGDYEGALKDLDQAIKLRSDDVLALVDRGIFRFLTGDYEGALGDLNVAIKHDPVQPKNVLKLRDAIMQILAEREELVKLREENAKLKAELEALKVKAAADINALNAKAAADIEALNAKAAADIEALNAKAEAEAVSLRQRNQKLQEDLNRAEEALKKMPQNQSLELQYNNLCCEKCIRDIKGALSKVPGVESVTEDMYSNRVTVTGYVSASTVLTVCQQTSPSKVINVVGGIEAPEPTPAPDPESLQPALHEPEPDVKPEPAPEPEAAAPAEPEPMAASEPDEAKSAPEPAPRTEPAPEPEEVKPDPEPAAQTESAPESEVSPEAQQPESETTPADEQPTANGEIQEESST